ncbi:VOC family protein [Pseudoxanthomonas dokdonensis]|uniref:Glyoxalase n=1 Tax=Pseudoxanthomonas dokdonensis TaxID=344882 RepID=A0A0R0CX59_9GAMM|nr:VOC family protein [Pseudoxanthomonas dokdonensis]KRG70970.1 glyoxalase [Pseudoxanthomonas dokdonensis]
MIDHVGLPVSDYPRSKQFYLAVMAAIDAGLVMEVSAADTGSEPAAGFGRGIKPDFWISPGTVGSPVHVALAATSRQQVDAFHRAALAAGARDHGAPGLRPHYHPDYYGAFVLDPDGHNIEAVCHCPEQHA